MIHTVIIDDEAHNISNLSGLIRRHCPEIKIVATATSAVEGIKIINSTKPDLVFLDIQMPDKNGFDMLKSLGSNHFEIIFVTAFDHYAIQAIKFAAIDYLLKPIDIEELKAAVQKVSDKANQKKQNPQLENLLQLLENSKAKTEHRIALPSVREIRFVKTDDIIRCESSNSYTSFYLVNKEKLMISRPILEYEEILSGYDFIRCHQSHLVNKKFIISWLKSDGDYLLLEDKTQIPVSRQRKEYVKERLNS